jgi:hypothetical protein
VIKPPTRRGLLVALLFVGSWIATRWVGHRFVEAVYRGDLPSFESLFEGKTQLTLPFYLTVMDGLVTSGHSLVLIALLLFLAYRAGAPRAFLAVLVLGDVLLAVLGLYFGGAWFAVEFDQGVPEFFQYFKEIGIVVGLLLLYRRHREPIEAALAGLFLFFFITDAFQYHERFGLFITRHLDLSSLATMLGEIRTQDVGELVSLIIPVGILGPLILVSYRRASAPARKLSIRILWFVLALALLGVVLDTIGRMPFLLPVKPQISFLEDFGEMIVMSFVLGLVVSRVRRDERTAPRPESR